MGGWWVGGCVIIFTFLTGERLFTCRVLPSEANERGTLDLGHFAKSEVSSRDADSEVSHKDKSSTPATDQSVFESQPQQSKAGVTQGVTE